MQKNKPYELYPEAQSEIEGTYIWHSQRSLDATVGFLTGVDEDLDVVSKTPHRWPTYVYGTRRYLVKGFPFSIVHLDGLTR